MQRSEWRDYGGEVIEDVRRRGMPRVHRSANRILQPKFAMFIIEKYQVYFLSVLSFFFFLKSFRYGSRSYFTGEIR